MRVLALPKDQAKNAEGLLDPVILKAMMKGLPVTVLIALDGNKAVGALGGAVNDKVFEIISLYVDPKSRRKGAARSMVDTLTRLLKNEDSMIRARFNIETEENSTLEDFFKAMNFEKEEVGFPAYYMVNTENLLGSEEDLRNSEDIRSFSEVPGQILRRTTNMSIDAGYPVPEGGLSGTEVDYKASCCSIKEETIEAYVAAEKERDKMVRIPAMWSSLSDPRKMMSMLFYTSNALKEKYAPNMKVAALAINPVSGKIIKHMFNDEDTISRCYTYMVV